MANKYIGALWLKKSKKGLVYMSGQLEIDDQKIQITVFKNERKEKKNQPDYQILKSEPYNPKKDKAETIEKNNEEDVPVIDSEDPNEEAQRISEETKDIPF